MTISCDKEKIKICDIKHNFSRVVLKTDSNDCGKKNLMINDRTELDTFYKQLCESESIFILNTQGDIWYINIFVDGFNDKLLSLTKTVHGTYYFRDKNGTYKNDILAKKLAKIMEVECLAQ